MDTIPVIVSLTVVVLIMVIVYIEKNVNIYGTSDITMNDIVINPSPQRITVVTLETRTFPLLELHQNNMNEYCAKHNYSYQFYSSYQSPYPVYWQKLQVVLDELNKNNSDYVMWMDTDALFVNQDIKIESILQSKPDKSIFIGYDIPRVLNYCSYCAGIFIIKNNNVGKQFLKDCLEQLVTNPDCKFNGKYMCTGIWAGICYEQGMMNQLLMTTSYQSHLCVVDPSLFLNSYELFPKTFIHHYMGDKVSAYNYFSKLNVK